MPKPRRQLPFRVPHDLADKVTAAAEAEGLSINAWLMTAAIHRLSSQTLVKTERPATVSGTVAPFLRDEQVNRANSYRVRPAKREANPIPKKGQKS